MLDKAWFFLEYARTGKVEESERTVQMIEDAYEEVRTMRTLPRIVCLCGSTRFIDEFRDANLRFTLGGEIVLSIGSDNQYEGSPVDVDENAKAMLDALHFRKIDLADRIFIINKNGYIGKSTFAELKYATRNGKPIAFLEDGCWRYDSKHPETKVAVSMFMEAVRREIEREEQPNGLRPPRS